MATEKTYELKENAGGHTLYGEDSSGNSINKVMEAGERIKSSKPIVEMFPNKFFCVEDAEKKIKVARAPFSEPVRPHRLNSVGTAALGEDDEPDLPEVYDPNVDHTTDPDAEPKVEHRAARLGMAKKTEKQKRKELKKAQARGTVINDDSELEDIDQDDEDMEPEEDEETEKGEGRPDGKDVTPQFKGAKENTLKVFYHDKHYHVFEAEDLETPLASAPLTKKAMQKFVTDFKG